MSDEIIIFEEEGNVVEVRLDADHDTVWLSQKQMGELFGKDVRTINEHIKNLYHEEELEQKPTIRKFRTVQQEGSRKVKREIEHYNLDVIISLGYRVKSKQGTRFRQWATRTLREHLIQGYTLNEKLLKEQNTRLSDLRNTVMLLEKTLHHQAVGEDEAKGLLKVMSDYAYALATLDRFDHGTLAIEGTTPQKEYLTMLW